MNNGLSWPPKRTAAMDSPKSSASPSAEPKRGVDAAVDSLSQSVVFAKLNPPNPREVRVRASLPSAECTVATMKTCVVCLCHQAPSINPSPHPPQVNPEPREKQQPLRPNRPGVRVRSDSRPFRFGLRSRFTRSLTRTCEGGYVCWAFI